MIWKGISKPLLRQFAAVIVVNLSLICFGMGLAWPSPVLVKLSAVNGTDNILSRPITENEGSWIVSIGFLFATFANMICPYLVDTLGRKYSVLLACAPKLISVVLFLFASTLWMILLGRVMNSLGDSVLMTVVPMYASEVASKEIRGALGTILPIATALGTIIMFSVGPFLSYVTLHIVFLCIVILTTIPVLFIPDSPYFLYTKGHTEKSRKVLIYFRGSEKIANEELLEYASLESEEKLDTRSLLRDKAFLKGIWLISVVMIGLQIVGFNSISFNLQTILESTNTSVRSETASAIVGSIELIACICTAFMTDKFGRKPILGVSFSVMALGMIGLGVFFYLQGEGIEITGALNFLPLASLIVVVFCYNAGYGSVFIAEFFGGPTRGIGCTFGVCLTTFFLFITTYTFTAMNNAMGPAATYWMFAGLSILFAMFTTFVLPETKGKTFAEIQTELGHKRNVVDKLFVSSESFSMT